jgi:hypothetical protein
MSGRAKVRSVKALKDARAAVLEFMTTARSALATVNDDIQRISEWLVHDRPAYWKHEIRRREDDVVRWRLEMERKRMIAAPDPASTVFEEKQLRRARERVESARRKLEAVRRWQPIWEREARNSLVMLRGLEESLDSDLPRGVALLERLIAAVEQYAAIRPARTEKAEEPPPAEEEP